MSRLAGFHHVALTVRDLDASERWYQDVLGLTTLFREEGDSRRAAVMQFADGGFAVGLVEHRPSDGTPFDPTRLGLDHLALLVRSRAELDDWAARLAGAGIEQSGVIDVPPGAILNFKDPDGIALSLFWDRD
jgi:glyoxylase I family protein